MKKREPDSSSVAVNAKPSPASVGASQRVSVLPGSVASIA
jgi:hypothetical protein